MQFQAFINAVENIVAPEKFVASLQAVLQSLGFEAFNYGCGRLASNGAMDVHLIWSTLDPEWISHYVARNYYREDRLVRASIFRISPFYYEEIFETPPQFSCQLEMETRFPYKSGIVVPIHGPNGRFGLLSAAAPRERSLARDDWSLLAKVQFVANLFHERVLRLDLPSSHPALEIPPVSLRPRESECLAWVSAGKTNREIGQLLALSENTVKKHIKTAMAKLVASTRGQAVSRAIALQLIDPSRI
jgi:DNA-binding CsgD family transcriptional regulator